MKDRLPSVDFVKILFYFVFFTKIILYFLLKYYYEILTVGGSQSGNDSEYYHAYALGFNNNAVNFWSVTLRFLNNLDMYNRDYVSLFLFLLSLIMPFVCASLFESKRYLDIQNKQKQTYWLIILIVSFYPAIFFKTLDIYRDLLMFFLFCVCLLLVKKYTETGGWFRLVKILVIIFLLYLLRGYLGFSLGCALFLCRIKFNLNKIYTLFFFYFLSLFLLKKIGYLDPVIIYRDVGFQTGESTLNLDFLSAGPIKFLPLYIYSILLQLFGLFFNSWKAVIGFISESLLFIVLFFYIIKNRQYMKSPLLRFIAFFFVVYASIWCLGNDNLGTAVRLRVFNYISVYVMAGIIYLEKEMAMKKIIAGNSKR